MSYTLVHYGDTVLIELLGIWLEKANTGNYEDREEIERRLYQLSNEMRSRKLKYIKKVIDNEQARYERFKKSRKET